MARKTIKKKSAKKIAKKKKPVAKKIKRKQTIKDDATINAVMNLRATGWTIVRLAKEFKVGQTTINRWIREAKKKNIDSRETSEGPDKRMNKLVEKSWKVIDDALTANKLSFGKSVPDHAIRLTAAVRVLNNQGELIEKKDVNLNFSNLTDDELADIISEDL